MCGERFEDSGILERHDKSIHTLKKYRCDYCDILVEAANGIGAVLSMQKHHEICLCKPKVIVEETRFTCELCGYISISEDTFKRHNRDKHDDTTKSTSPKPKRRRKLSNVEKMETDEIGDNKSNNIDDREGGQVMFVEPMDEDPIENEILTQRSNLQKEKRN